MHPERALRVEQLYHAALEREESERPAFLDNACAGDPDLRAEMESLLRHEKQSDQFIDRRPVDAFAAAIVLEAEQSQGGFAKEFPLQDRTIEKPPDTVYHLRHKLGEGGMGQVWLAEQTSPVRRQVALKLIKAGMYDHAVVQRFEAERQSLAIMDHPAIAKVFDAGATPQGQPYFVMEYVQGLPITEYCDRKKLRIRDRLELFIQVCEGVQHAHQKAIIHRDLKPANILVVDVDGKPVPRIIDFGLAKAASPKLDDETMLTQQGHFLGTPGYMSPEQADPNEREIDTRTDVYSLAVVLYVLLAGSPPFDTKKWRSEPFEEVMRTLREEEPPRPSAKVSGERDTSAATAEARGTEPRQLVSLLRGDLDWITMKGLEKDRARRYGSPAELAADINRYLHHEPITARPASAAYRAKKYLRRHTALAVGGAAVFAVLVAGVVVSTWQAARARAAERRATSEAASARATNDFLQNDLLAQADVAKQSETNSKPDPDLRVRTVLDRAAERIAGRFDQQPEVEASIRETIGKAYIGVGEYAAAEKQMERALELRRKLLGPENPQALKTAFDLGRAEFLQGKRAEVEVLQSQTLESQRRVLGPDNPDTLQTMSSLANVYNNDGKYPQAEALEVQTVEIQRRVLGSEHHDTLLTLSRLADTYDHQGKYPQAEALCAQALEIRRRVLGPEHPDTLTAMYNLAWEYRNQGKYPQAEALNKQVLEIRRRVLGPEHPETVNAMHNVAGTYYSEGKYAQAEAIFEQILEIRRRVLGLGNSQTAMAMTDRASAYVSLGKYVQAEALYIQALEIQRRLLGPEHPDTLLTMMNLASDYSDLGKNSQAAALLNQVLEIRRRVLGAENPNTLITMFNLAGVYDSQGKYAESAPLYRKTLEIQRRVLGPEHPDALESANNLAGAYESQGKYAESAALYIKTLEIRRRVLGPEHPKTLFTMVRLGDLYYYEGKYDEAAALQGQAMDIQRRVLGPEHPDTLDAMNSVASTYESQGKLVQAEALFQQILAVQRRTLGVESADTLDAMADLALAYEMEGKFREGEVLAREAIGGDRKTRPDDWQRFFAGSLLGANLMGQKEYAEAEPLLLEGYRGMDARKEKISVPDRRNLKHAREWLAQLYQAWGKPDAAAEWQQPAKAAPH